MKIVYLPLDERPCNYMYPKYVASQKSDVELKTIDINNLGDKKKPANLKKVNEFLSEGCLDADYLLISIDMLVYGGLIPSRIHNDEYEELLNRLEQIKSLKDNNPSLIIYAFSSIMRTPKYNSSDEEPEYYEENGLNIFNRKYYMDKKCRDSLTQEEEEILSESIVNDDIIKDYETRRELNLKVSIKVLDFVKSGLIDHLITFQDDSAPYGYTAIDQKVYKEEISNQNLEFKVDIYPGADEVGCTLVAKAINSNRNSSIYPIYSSVNGPYITPLYEDRPYFETMKSHIISAGLQLSYNIEECDYILMVNTPGEVMQESWDQFNNRDRSYDSHRNLKEFVFQIKKLVEMNKKVIVSDVAYANGCDMELIKLLDELDLIDKIYAYSGWNTDANTLGTVLAGGSIIDEINEVTIKNNIYHILEAGFYQAIIRMDVNKNILPKLGLNYFDIYDKMDEVINIEQKMMYNLYNQLKISSKYPIKNLKISHPWRRMFEIDVDFDLEF